MTNFKISNSGSTQFRAAVEYINTMYSYEPIWYLAADNTVSKEKKDGSIPVPTTLQISDALITACEQSDRPLTHYLIKMAEWSLHFQSVTLVELQVITLAIVMQDTNNFIVEAEGTAVQEDPFTKDEN